MDRQVYLAPIAPSLIDPSSFRLLDALPAGFEPTGPPDVAAGRWPGTILVGEAAQEERERIAQVMEGLWQWAQK